MSVNAPIPSSADGLAPFLREIVETEQDRPEPAVHEHARSAIASYELAGGTVRFSDELGWIFGIDPSTFRGTHAELLERVHPDDRARVLERDRALVPDHPPYDEYRIVRPDGTVRILRRWTHPLVDAHRRTVRVFAIVQDVTDQC